MKRKDLNTDEEIDEEIIADQLEDVMKRAGFLKDIGRKDQSLIERVIAWLQDMMSKFREYFQNPQGKLTREQAQRMANELGRMAREIVNQKGEKIFRHNTKTNTIQLATGESLENLYESSERETKESAKAAQTKKALVELARTAWNDKNFNGKVSFTPSKKFRDKAQEIFGHDVTEVFITAGDIRHIKKHHGENEEKRGQVDMTPDDIAGIYDIVNDFSSAKRERDDKDGNKAISVTSKDGLGYTLLIERGKRKAQVRTSFKWKKAQVLNVTSPEPNVRNDPVLSSAGNIPQAEQEHNAALVREFGGRIENGEPVFDNTRDEAEYYQHLEDLNSGKIKYSVANTGANSTGNTSATEKLKTKLKNLLTVTKNERTHNRMRKLLEELSGYRIRTGRFSKAVDKPDNDVAKVIRSSRAYDWDTILPAVGKLVAQRLNLDTSKEMSDCIANWLVDGINDNSPEAQAFQAAMRNADDYYRNKILEVRELFDEWNKRPPGQKVMDTIAFDTPEKPLTDKAKGFFYGAYEQFVEELYPIKQLVDDFEEELGRKLKPEEDPYVLLRNYRGMAGRAKIMVEGNASAIDALKTSLPNVNFDGGFKTVRMILESIGAHENEEKRNQLTATTRNQVSTQSRKASGKSTSRLKVSSNYLRCLVSTQSLQPASATTRKQEKHWLNKTAERLIVAS